MDILIPHDGLTNEKICKAQIEAVEKKQNEYKLIGRLTKVPGHTLYKFNATTRDAPNPTIIGDVIDRAIRTLRRETKDAPKF